MGSSQYVVDAAGGSARAPLISLVLPVSGVERYLPACLDSILGQPVPRAGIEIIAVDDASPDGCGAILDERATREPRLRVIHLAAPAGPGPARTAGLAEAAGDYVWFVDPDDLVTGDCLVTIEDRLVRDRPDVLLLDYLILLPSGGTEASHAAGLLSLPGGQARPVTLAERPALLNRTMTSWSKVMSRSFLDSLGVAFAPGIHEDVAVSCALLLRARRIGLLDRVCYLYRQRAGSFVATVGRGHFAIFPAYEQVFGMVAAAVPRTAAGAPVRAAVFGRAIEHYSSILGSGLVPAPARREFFGRMRDDFRRYRPPGWRRPPGLRGLRILMIERNAYRLYATLAPLNNARVTACRALRRLARSTRRAAGPPPARVANPPGRGEAARAANSLPDHGVGP